MDNRSVGQSIWFQSKGGDLGVLWRQEKILTAGRSIQVCCRLVWSGPAALPRSIVWRKGYLGSLWILPWFDLWLYGMLGHFGSELSDKGYFSGERFELRRYYAMKTNLYLKYLLLVCFFCCGTYISRVNLAKRIEFQEYWIWTNQFFKQTKKWQESWETKKLFVRGIGMAGMGIWNMYLGASWGEGHKAELQNAN